MNLHSNGLFRFWTASGSIDNAVHCLLRLPCQKRKHSFSVLRLIFLCTLKRFVTTGTFVVFVLIALFSTSVNAQTYFYDDFENPAESEAKWEVITGEWEVSDGVYHQLSTADPWQASMVAWDQWSNEWEYVDSIVVFPYPVRLVNNQNAVVIDQEPQI